MASRLTVGLATYRDFDGCYFSLQSLRAHHGNQFDILVLDNAPERCIRTEQVTNAVKGTYYHRPDLSGTSRSRDAIFRLAKTPWVMVVDSHVLFEPGAIEKLLWLIQTDKHNSDLLTGPLVMDDGVGIATHWRPTTPPGLWGVWDRDERGHGTEPFDIPMQGLGCFAMRRKAWPGFHPKSRGFGGEEGYIHEKVRRQGGRVLCVPQLRWRHRFRDIGGFSRNPTPYAALGTDHAFNLLIQHRELGIDAVDAIKQDFGPPKMSVENWERILKEAKEAQPNFIEAATVPSRQRIVGVWYTDNTAPPNLLGKSLASISAAAKQTWRHDVQIWAVSWENIPEMARIKRLLYAGEKKRSHATIIKQIRAALHEQEHGWTHQYEEPPAFTGKPSAVCFLEHDVLYPQDYFQRVGDAFAANPSAPVVSNLDYIGLNAQGFQPVKERHEPMHQLSMRYEFAMENLNRAAKEAESGSALLEPQEYESPTTGLLGYDMDGTLHRTGLRVLQGREYVIITGRPLCDGEYSRTKGELKNDGHLPAKEIYLRDTKTYTDSEIDIARHKADTIKRLGIVEYWEDNKGIADSIRQQCPGVTVHHVQGGRFDTRSSWVRLKETPGLGLIPSIHVNHTAGRFTSHGDVCYAPASSTTHPHWGEHRSYWPHEVVTVAKQGCGSCGNSVPAVKHESLAAWFDAASKNPSDFHEHMATLRDLAAKCEHVTQIGIWGKPSRVALAMGMALRVPSWADWYPKGHPTWEISEKNQTRAYVTASPGSPYQPGQKHVVNARTMPGETAPPYEYHRCEIEIESVDGDPLDKNYIAHAHVIAREPLGLCRFVDYSPSKRPEWRELEELMGWGDRFQGKEWTPDFQIEPTDLLLCDTYHTAEETYNLFTKHAPQVRKYLVVHTTTTFGETGDQAGKAGVRVGIRRFIAEHKEWTVIRDDTNNHGLMVLSRLDEDRKALPSLMRKGLNFVSAKAKHLAAGRPVVSEEVFNFRMELCLLCPERAHDSCSACGCPLEAKLAYATEPCGLVKLGREPKWEAVA